MTRTQLGVVSAHRALALRLLLADGSVELIMKRQPRAILAQRGPALKPSLGAELIGLMTRTQREAASAHLALILKPFIVRYLGLQGPKLHLSLTVANLAFYSEDYTIVASGRAPTRILLTPLLFPAPFVKGGCLAV